VRALRAEGDRVTGAVTDAETVQADVYLLALGVGSPRVARTIAVKLPIPGEGLLRQLPDP
jgi:glycine/D-amino acid oxidase-like deaminating enzyme